MDDEPDWFGGGDEEETTAAAAEAAPEAAPAAGGATAPEASEDAGEAAPGGEAAEEKREEAEDEYLDPDKLLLFKHWIRPKFLQYKYLYDYQHNYYNDVIDYLDKRQKGIRRDIPVAQTWAERALRTYTSKPNTLERFKKTISDTKLVEKTRLSGAIHSYHSKAYFNRTYSRVLVPKFLQYKYLYDYRRNYYNDVMEVVERRQKGFRRDIPRAQTWAERVLRSRSLPTYKCEMFDRHLEDVKLVTRSQISGHFHKHYLKESFNKSSCSRLC